MTEDVFQKLPTQVHYYLPECHTR